jgi:hypothetical protein
MGLRCVLAGIVTFTGDFDWMAGEDTCRPGQVNDYKPTDPLLVRVQHKPHLVVISPVNYACGIYQQMPRVLRMTLSARPKKVV